MDDYLNVSRFLPKLNNEILGERNAAYKERLSSLENLVLIMVRLTKPEISFRSTFKDYMVAYILEVGMEYRNSK